VVDITSSSTDVQDDGVNTRLILFMAADIVVSDPATEPDNAAHAYIVEFNYPMPLETTRHCYYPRMHAVQQFFAGNATPTAPPGVPHLPLAGQYVRVS